MVFDTIEVTVQDEGRSIYQLKIQTEDSAILIGPHGKTRSDLQNLLVQMVENAVEGRCFVHLEINDYLESKEKKLISIIDRKIEETKKTGYRASFGDLSGFERKQVHDYVGKLKDKKLSTHSEDTEDKKRILYIEYEKEVEIDDSLDLDGIDI